MSPTFTLSPLLTELGAVVPGRGFYLPVSQLDGVEEAIEEAIGEYSENLLKLARLAASIAPAPSAARRSVQEEKGKR